MSTLINCRGCGAPLGSDQLFCGNCGVRRTDGLTGPQTGPQPTGYQTGPQPGQQAMYQTGPQPTGYQTGPQPWGQDPTQQYAAQPAVSHVPPTWAPAGSPTDKTLGMSKKQIGIMSGITALVMVVAIAGAVLSAPAPVEPAGDLVGQMPFGPEGGTGTFDNGQGKVDVPKGALSKPETIVVRRTVVRDRVTAQGPTGAPLIFPPGALIAYTFGPITLVLNRPITITLRLPAGQAGLIFVTANGQIRFFPGTVAGQTIRLRLRSLRVGQPGAIVIG